MTPGETPLSFYIYLGYLYYLDRLYHKQGEPHEHNTPHKPYYDLMNALTKYLWYLTSGNHNNQDHQKNSYRRNIKSKFWQQRLHLRRRKTAR